MSQEINACQHSPIDLMRQPQRILNHRKLLQEKVAIGKKYGLIESNDIPPDLLEANLQQIEQLLAGDIQYPEARDTILSNLSQAELERSKQEFDNDLWKAFRVGLVEFHITDRCDLACKNCFYGSSDNGKGATMPFAEINKLQLVDPRAVVVTGGGEPTVYNENGNAFSAAMAEIRRAAPQAQIGVQTNGTIVPKGDWSKNVLYLRSSVDADRTETYQVLKNRDYFDRVVANVVDFAKTGIPFVGVGFLFERQNVDEIPPFIERFYDLVSSQVKQALGKFTIQFRPLGPDLTVLQSVRSEPESYAEGATAEQMENLKLALEDLRRRRPELGPFLDRQTNLDNVWPGNSGHPLVSFKNCFVSMGYRMVRAGGDNFPCFILVQHQRFCLGNYFGKDPKQEPEAYLRVALCGYHFFNCRSEYCNPEHCRQSRINCIGAGALNGAAEMPQGQMAEINFF